MKGERERGFGVQFFCHQKGVILRGEISRSHEPVQAREGAGQLSHVLGISPSLSSWYPHFAQFADFILVDDFAQRVCLEPKLEFSLFKSHRKFHNKLHFLVQTCLTTQLLTIANATSPMLYNPKFNWLRRQYPHSHCSDLPVLTKFLFLPQWAWVGIRVNKMAQPRHVGGRSDMLIFDHLHSASCILWQFPSVR